MGSPTDQKWNRFLFKKKQLDRINRIVRIKRPPAKGPLAAGDRKSPKSCKSCLSKKHKIESIPMFHMRLATTNLQLSKTGNNVNADISTAI
jgi:hypothetical protein